MAGFGVAIAWHAAGFNVRRQSWPTGQHVRADCCIREPRGNLVLIRDWDPADADLHALDWQLIARAAPDVIEASGHE
tara:strand:+ start:5313 stop:5543 length:231 start_codon:yes stop_codon:yes gene_type:complete